MIGITRYFLSITAIHFCCYTVMKLDFFISYGFAQILHNYLVSLVLIKPLYAPCKFGVLVKFHHFGLVILVVLLLLI